MKKRLFVITLEPIEKRYTGQWYNQWKKYFEKFDVTYIDGHEGLNNKISKGRFLDINKTNIVKSNQVIKLAKMFQNNEIDKDDSFIFMDAFHFGITALKYMAQLNEIDINIYGFWHSGTWDKFDFITQAGMGKWASDIETGWLKALDGSFVATEFHKKLIYEKFKNLPDIKKIIDKIHVVGFPMDWKECIESEYGQKYDNIDLSKKENIVVFPHRIDYEKNPESFEELANSDKTDTQFIKTMEVTENKKQYYDILKKAKISFSGSLQETFGIGTVEAVLFDCYPLVPNRLAYTEMYPECFLYNNKEELTTKLDVLLNDSNREQLELLKNKFISDGLETFNLISKIMEKN